MKTITNYIKRFLLLAAMVVVCATAWSAGTLLPVSSTTGVTGDQLFVRIDGYPSEIYPMTKGLYSFENTENCAADRQIDSYNDASASYLYFILKTAATTGIGEYKITYTNGANTACAIITFADGSTTNPTITACSAPNPAVAIAATTVTENTIKVDWTRAHFSNVTAQKVYYKKSSDSEYSSANVGSTTALTYTITGLTCGTAYDVYVSATEDATEYESSGTQATPTDTEPQLPVLTTSTAGSGAEMLLRINGYGTTYPKNAIYYSYENTANCAEAREITGGPTASDQYLVFSMDPGSTGIGEYEITYTNGETTACAVVTFASGSSSNPTITACSGGSCQATVTIGTVTSNSSTIIIPFEYEGFTSTPTFTEQHRLSPSGTWSTAATVTSPAVITGLDEATSYDIKITGTYQEETAYDEVTVATTNPTTCSGSSDVKNTVDASLKDKCDFGVDYEFEISTTDLTENDPKVLVRYRYTQPESIDNNQVKLCRMFQEGQIESEFPMSAEAGGNGWWSVTLEGETLGNKSVGDSAKFAIKVVTVGGCDIEGVPSISGFYATRMFAYKVGVGCNDARAFEFTKRLASQTTFFIQTDASIQRILVKKKGSSEYIQDNHIEPAASKFALDIRGYELGTYEFEIFDESGRSDDIKIIHTVY